jgi:hypothetical protein
MLTTLAWGAADLTINHIGTAALDKTTFSMGLEVKNIGNTPYTGVVRLKPFIVPEVNAANIVGFKPIQFSASATFISIPAGQSQIVTYYAESLPNIPLAKYWIGATVVPDAITSENSVQNNTTNKLLQMGNFSNIATLPIDTEVDIYSDVRSQISPVNGRANHPWRLSWRGTRTLVDRMRVLFNVLDTKKMYVYPSTYEKSVGWVHMGADYDEKGRLVPYDVYNQGPDFNAAAPGDLFLLTTSNYLENAFEFDHSNNIDARKFHASYISQKSSLEVWKTYVEEDPIPFNETVQFNSLFQSAKPWVLDRGNLPEDMVTSLSTGSTSSAYSILFSKENWTVDYGTYRYSAKLKIKNSADSEEVIEEKQINFNISKFVGGTQPVITAANSVQVSATSPFAPAPVQYVIENSGQSALSYKIEKNNDWIFFSNTSGTIAPGQSATITISFSPVGRDIGNSAGSFIIYNNSVDSHKLINVTYTDNAPVAP